MNGITTIQKILQFFFCGEIHGNEGNVIICHLAHDIKKQGCRILAVLLGERFRVSVGKIVFHFGSFHGIESANRKNADKHWKTGKAGYKLITFYNNKL